MGKEEPGKAEIEKLPQNLSFNTALVPETRLALRAQHMASGTADSPLFGDRISYVEAGEAAYTQEEKDEKEDTADDARKSLIELMKKENQASMDAARRIEDEHTRHKNSKLMPAVEVAKKKYKDSYVSLARFMAAYSALDPGNFAVAEKTVDAIDRKLGNESPPIIADRLAEIKHNQNHPKSSFSRKVIYGPKCAVLERLHETDMENAGKRAKEVASIADDWNDRLKKYHDNEFKKFSRNYDELFEDYYVLSRGVAQRSSPFLRAGDPGYSAENKDVAKDIAEYTGVYSRDNIGDFIHKVSEAPVNPYRIAIVAGKTTKQGSRNQMSNLLKLHRTVTMEAFGVDDQGAESITSVREEVEHQSPPRIRIKVGNDFKGYTARHQYDEQGQLYDRTAPKPGQGVNLSAGMGHLPDKANPRGLDGIRLRVNETGKNRELLFSQKSAHIYSIPAKKGKGSKKAIFVGSRLIPADPTLITDPDKAKKWDMSAEGNIARREKLRTAIRRSDYFRHINAATINYYMHYDGDKSNMTTQNVDRSFMARRAGFFDRTTLKQNLFDGTYQQLAGGILTMGFDGGTFKALTGKDEAKKAEAKALGVYKLFGDVVISSSDLHGQIKDKEDAAKFGAAYAVLAAVPMAATAVFDSANMATGGIFTNFFGTLVSMGKSISDIIDAVNSFKKKKNNAEGADAVYKVFQKIADFLGAAIGFINSTLGTLGVAAGALGDVVGGINILRDGLSLLRNGVEGFLSARQLYRIDRYDKELRTAMETPDDERGEAVSQNSQVRLALTQSRRKETIALTGNVANGLADFASGAGTVSGTWSPIGAPMKLASKALRFVGMGIQKGMKIGYQVSDIGTFIGDPGLFTVSGFDEVLKEETGINNKHYLPDLTKIFMAIDTHVMVTHGATKAEKELGKEVCELILRGDELKEDTDYERILKAVGAPDDWRSVMLESIAGEDEMGIHPDDDQANQAASSGSSGGTTTTTLASTGTSSSMVIPQDVVEVEVEDAAKEVHAESYNHGEGSTTGPGSLEESERESET